MGSCFTTQDAPVDVIQLDNQHDNEPNTKTHSANTIKNNYGNKQSVSYSEELTNITPNIREMMKDRAQKRLDSIRSIFMVRSLSTDISLSNSQKHSSDADDISTSTSSVSSVPKSEIDCISASVPSIASSEALYDAVSECAEKESPGNTLCDRNTLGDKYTARLQSVPEMDDISVSITSSEALYEVVPECDEKNTRGNTPEMTLRKSNKTIRTNSNAEGILYREQSTETIQAEGIQKTQCRFPIATDHV